MHIASPDIHDGPGSEPESISETVTFLPCIGVTTATGERVMANRITAAFARMEAQIADRIAKGLTSVDKVAALHGKLDMDLAEYARFQSLKTLAVAQGLLTPEEGQAISICLGESVQTFNDQPVHIKSVLTSFFAELLTAQIERAGQKKLRHVRRHTSAQPAEVSC